MQTIGCIIWRFQPLHNGHNLLIEASLKENKKTIVFIGSSNIINQQNPYNFEIRKRIIHQNFVNDAIEIYSLPDAITDEVWIQNIISHIPGITTNLKLYCGDQGTDSAIISIKKLEPQLPFNIEIIEIPRSIIPVSATQIRSAFKSTNMTFLKKHLSKVTIDTLKNIS